MKITKYPQSCVLINHKNKNILIDPGSFVYQQTSFKPEDWVKIDILLFTHEHFDHLDIDALKIILKNNTPVILTNSSVHFILKSNGIDSKILLPDEEIVIEEILIKGVKSKHGPLPDGRPAPDVIGFLIDTKAYHPGDSVYLNQKPYADVVFVPICGTVVMNPVEAAKFVDEIKCKIAIPIHYSNPKYPTSTKEFENEMKKYSEISCCVLKDQETMEVD
jgi:L-ascorbate metabolism protein UlaG (beta-lactamase superfamily)